MSVVQCRDTNLLDPNNSFIRLLRRDLSFATPSHAEPGWLGTGGRKRWKKLCPPELSFGECFWLPVGDSAEERGSYFTKEHLVSQMEVYLVGAGLASPLSSVLSSRNKPAASLMRLNSIQKAWTSMKRSCKIKRTDNECNHHVITSYLTLRFL